MLHFKKFLLSIFLCITLILISFMKPPQTVNASDDFAFVLLTSYSATLDIGENFYVVAFTSNGKKPTWKSSNSKVASVNTYGKVIAKKAGTATITAKIKNAEASCKVTVNKTIIEISEKKITMERNDTFNLSATASNGSAVTWKSNKKSVATVDEYGQVTAVKPGEATITVTANGYSDTCKVTVKKPTIQLSHKSISLYRNQSSVITAKVSSKVTPTWKSNKKSVATIDDNGKITAIKNGTAIITATVDGVSKSCEVSVKKPEITLSESELSLKVGENKRLRASVSSGNSPVWSTSNENKLEVSSDGTITALEKGKAYVYASEDGAKKRCTVTITE